MLTMVVVIAGVLVWVGLIGLLATFVVVYKKLYRAQLSMNAITSSIREHHQGLSLKWPWSTLQDPEINMLSEIIVTSGGILVMTWDKFISEKVYEKILPRIYETADSIVYGSWATAIRPLRGRLAQFVQKTPQVAALMVMAEVDLVISDYLAKPDKMTSDVLHQKKIISTMVENVFGGNNEEATSALELSYGVVVSNPKLFDLNLGKKSQDAAEDVFAAKKFKAALDEVKTAAGNDPEKAINAFLMYSGKGVQKQIYNIEGFESALKGIAEAFFASKKRRS